MDEVISKRWLTFGVEYEGPLGPEACLLPAFGIVAHFQKRLISDFEN